VSELSRLVQRNVSLPWRAAGRGGIVDRSGIEVARFADGAQRDFVLAVTGGIGELLGRIDGLELALDEARTAIRSRAVADVDMPGGTPSAPIAGEPAAEDLFVVDPTVRG
jgi:hypothetical protein